MAVQIPRALMEYVLLGPPGDHRHVQDSPILRDVWIAFAQQPDHPLDVLITPYEAVTAGAVALAIEQRLERSLMDDPDIAFLQRFVAARLYSHEILLVVVPMTGWRHSPRTQEELSIFFDPDGGPEKLNRVIKHILDVQRHGHGEARLRSPDEIVIPPWNAMLPLPA